ncbi:MAG TPA: hypothetical protein VHC98_01255 [Candidatus Saccharimonadales bacterium]|nr:hypothetical protein [Candidatus Saccharimonadales bacterium]
MKKRMQGLSRNLYAVVAAVILALAAGVPLVLNGTATAAQVTSRSIEMSNATAGATGVTYKFSFNTISTGSPSIQAIIVDFCDNDPLLADTTCTAPSGFSIASPTVTGQSTTAGCNISTFTVTTGTAAGAHTLELSAASAINVTTTPCAVSFSVTNVTNPNVAANHSFYARMYTYDTKAHADSYTAGGSTGVVDSGGVALSTAALINVTATVEETMTFCVTTATITGTCGGSLTAPSITLGHTVGSATVLTATQVDIAGVNTQLSTNANGGWVVRMKAGNTCTNGGLSSDGGTTCPIIGNILTGNATTLTAGAGAWGMCVNKGANTTVAAAYSDTANSCPATYNATSLYGMDGNNTTGTTSTFGSQVFSGTGAVSNEANTLEFVATAANTTPAGVYLGSESLIATGTF